MGALTVTISALSTLLLAALAYTVGTAGRMLGSPAVAIGGSAALGVAAGAFLIVPALTDLPGVVAEFWSEQPLLAKVTATPSDLPSALKELRRHGARPVGSEVTVELTLGEPVDPERQRWIERKVRVAFPGIGSARFASPSKLVLTLDTRRVKLEDVPKLVDRVSGWITYTSGYVVVGASATVKVRARRSALSDVQERFRGLVNVSVLFDPSRVVKQRVARCIPAPATALATTVGAFVLLGVAGWHGAVGRVVGIIRRKVRELEIERRRRRVVRLGKAGEVQR